MTVITKKPRSLEELMKLVKQASKEGAEVKFINADTGEEGIPEELADMLAKATADHDHDHDGDGCSVCGEDHSKVSVAPTGEVASALLDVVALHANPPQFAPGQFVRFRADVQYVKRSRDLHVVVERLKEPFRVPIKDSDDTGSPYAYRTYDVLIAIMTKRGICKYFCDSRELEIFPDADKLFGKHS